ncbi:MULTISPECIES: hypothetical protein [Bacillus]|uniref:hypothetical protein n=1 Tax=Bacillus TaxID=1386 RepID=UPI000C783876|nr:MULTISPECIES: hypothetical protein [Bacillus]MCP1161373.1 hypothetical protein [Bacillus infantis]PLR70466.1 hypothetical protein CYJ37_23315 [Bacillus sp. UMB0728]
MSINMTEQKVLGANRALALQIKDALMLEKDIKQEFLQNYSGTMNFFVRNYDLQKLSIECSKVVVHNGEVLENEPEKKPQINEDVYKTWVYLISRAIKGSLDNYECCYLSIDYQINKEGNSIEQGLIKSRWEKHYKKS